MPPFYTAEASADRLARKRGVTGPYGACSRRTASLREIVTNADILEAIAGAFRTDDGSVEPESVRRDDGSWLISGSMPASTTLWQVSASLPAIDTVAAGASWE
jgi:hypothetical protein